MRFNELDAWLSWLEQQHPKVIDLGLERVQQVASRLKVSEFDASTVVTVAGTNGKGSFICSLEALLAANGKTVAAYTSPHIFRFNERVRINQQDVSDQELMDAFDHVDNACEEISLTYFEFTTLAAFVIFSKKQATLDYILLEVGLGGRLDAVNIIEPDWAVLTSIAMDHQDYLGDTLESIAAEKLGILRENTPLVCLADEPETLLNEARAAREVIQLGIGFTCDIQGKHWSFQSDNVVYSGLRDNGLSIKSQAGAVALVNKVLEAPMQVEEVLDGLTLPGRFQQFEADGVDYFLDVAHNPEALQLLKKRLEYHPLPEGKKRLAIFTMFANKDVDTAVEMMKDQFKAWFIAESDNNRVVGAHVLAEKLHQQGINMVSVSKNLSQALARVNMMVEPGDQVVLFGSFEVASALLPKLERISKKAIRKTA